MKVELCDTQRNPSVRQSDQLSVLLSELYLNLSHGQQ